MYVIFILSNDKTFNFDDFSRSLYLHCFLSLIRFVQSATDVLSLVDAVKFAFECLPRITYGDEMNFFYLSTGTARRAVSHLLPMLNLNEFSCNWNSVPLSHRNFMAHNQHDSTDEQASE